MRCGPATRGARRRKPALQLAEACAVAAIGGIFPRAVLEACEVGRQLTRGPGGKAVDHPVGVSPRTDQASPFQVGQVLRDLHLGFTEDALDVADAQFAGAEEV